MSELSTEERRLLEVLADRARQQVEAAQRAGWRYSSVEHLVIEHGRWFDAAPLLADPSRVISSYSGVAAWAASEGLAYVEGYVLTDTGEVTPGAWCSDMDANVVAGTLGVAYRGIPLTKRFREESRRRSGSVSVLHAGERHQPYLLGRELPSHATLPLGRKT